MDIESSTFMPNPKHWPAVNSDIESDTLINLLRQGKYLDVLRSQPGKTVLTPVKFLKDNIIKYLSDDSNSAERSRSILAVGIAALQLFVQHNWTGPSLDTASELYQQVFSDEIANDDEIIDVLRIDGECIYILCSVPAFLFVSRVIFFDCIDLLSGCKTSQLWKLRYLQIHQFLLEERSPTLKVVAMELIQNVENGVLSADLENCKEMGMLFHVQAGNLCFFYYEPSKAKEHFKKARELSGLEIGLTGALGKRTLFQENEISQLVLKVERLSPSEDNVEEREIETIENTLLPKNLRLDDDTVMDSIKFKNSEEQFAVGITSSDQALLLALLSEHRKFHEGVGKIIQEESLAYVNCILQQPLDWCVQTAALLARCTWECDSGRRIERSMTQLEELVKQVKKENPPVTSRIQQVYNVNLPPKWKIERQLAELFVAMGATNAALEIYLRLQVWEEVVKCYISTGRTEKAESTIRDQLSVKETPEMWCFLGDVTHEEEHYMRSWELSNCHYSRAQRNLAYLFLNNGDFEKALPCFEKSVNINALQIGVWFSYGCAAIGCENYEVASTAFRRCVTLDPQNHEAWNNLSTAYIKSNQKSRAFLTLQEALKCDYENWRIWENYALVGTDIGEFEEVMRSYHRLLDLRGKHEDTQVLRILCKAINENIDDASGNPSNRLRKKALELLGRVTSKVTTNGDIWRVYGELLLNSDDPSQSDRERALQYFQKCHRCNTQSMGWEKEVEKCKEISAQSADLVSAYLKCNDGVTDNTQAVRLLSSARLMLKGVLTKIKQRHTDPISSELLPELVDTTNELDEGLKRITDCIDERKNAQ